jgi:hypothetical protein
MIASAWLVLGFSGDDIVGGGQDWRLAEECVRAWRAGGYPADFHVLQANGEGPYLTYWFVNATAARVLDAHAVEWRNRVVGSRAAPPTSATNALKSGPE